MWLLIAGLAGVASATDNFFNRLALRGRIGDVPGYTLVYFILISLFLLPFCFPFDFSRIRLVLPFVVLQGIAWSAATVAGFLARSSTDVTMQSLISQSRVLWLIAMGPIFLAEKLTGLAVVGISVVFVGFMVLFYDGKLRRHWGMSLVALAALFAALGSVLNTVLVRGALGVFRVSFLMVALQLPVLFLLFLLRGKGRDEDFGEVLTEGMLKETVGFGRRLRVKNVLQTRGWLLLGATLVEAAAVVGINWAYQIGANAPATAVFMAVSVVMAMVLGIIFLKERELMGRKVLSAAIIIVGIVLMKFAS